jgi:hypothetical protein
MAERQMCLFLDIKSLAATHVAGRSRVRSIDGSAPKWSGIVVSPRRFRRTDITIHAAVGAPPMATVEFGGDVAIVVEVARRQGDLGERLAELTKAPGDPEPMHEEGSEFIAAPLEFFDALN